jgi:hypothetical protein
MKVRDVSAPLAALLLMASTDTASGDELALSNKWRIEVSGGANSDGMLSFRITPKDGQPVEVAIPIDDGRGENNVAEDIRNGLGKALGGKPFDVEVDDGEDVLVRKTGGPDFEVKLVASTVRNIHIEIERE